MCVSVSVCEEGADIKAFYQCRYGYLPGSLWRELTKVFADSASGKVETFINHDTINLFSLQICSYPIIPDSM